MAKFPSINHLFAVPRMRRHSVVTKTMTRDADVRAMPEVSVTLSYCMNDGTCGACRRKWQLTDTDLCPCGETQTMSHIVESCPLTKLNGGLSRLHSADEDAVSWLINYGK